MMQNDERNANHGYYETYKNAAHYAQTPCNLAVLVEQ